MSYSEVIKNFNRIRDYMREFYVYGFKGRDGFPYKSGRSYDDERRRLESWLGDYMGFYQTPEGKRVFLSIDSRSVRHNPLYKAWKARSFTDGDITFHFILLDILASAEQALCLGEILTEIDRYLSGFREPRIYDESTVRRKLKEYVSEGILMAHRKGKVVYYSRAEDTPLPGRDMLDFFSETAPCGVIGSFLLDKGTMQEGIFAYKHHYITGALDSEILCQLFLAMREERAVTLEMTPRRGNLVSRNTVVPLQIMASAQGGRQYLMAYVPGSNRIRSFRLDHIALVRTGERSPRFHELRQTLDGMRAHMWGISTQGRMGQRMGHVEFTVQYDDQEQHIHRRLEREKRCGRVERIDRNTSRFSADVYDASELVPWIRTFICRITDIHFSDTSLETRFREDLKTMYRLYGLEGGDST